MNNSLIGTLMELEKNYEAKSTEEKIYQLWEKSGFFNPDKLPKRHKKPFTIIMPPPNANGSLHIGHALFVSLEDVMTRYQRMKGRKALWLPGADHAGFETQVVYNKKLEKEGRSFWGMDREQLYKEIFNFTLQNKGVMEHQLKKLGASCDWSREKFTLDENIVKVVHQTFKKLYEDNLVYRAEKPVNWCTKHQTTLSDLEIKYEEKLDKLYYIKYKISDSEDFIEVATTRPETIPADVAIAVHPKSKWKDYIGKKVLNPITKKEIIVIADEMVDLEFGTGALKITPHHDAVDFTIWNNHKSEINFEPFSVINQYGKLDLIKASDGIENAEILDNIKSLESLKVKEAREKVVEILKPNFSKDPEDYKHQVSVCYKCGTSIEPRTMMQWYIKMTDKTKSGKVSLRDSAVKAVKSKQIVFAPKRLEKVFLHWMKELRDWNISRQITWGIQIPAYYDILNSENSEGVISFKKDSFILDNEKQNILRVEAKKDYITIDAENPTSISSCSFEQAKIAVEKKWCTLAEIKKATHSAIVGRCNKPVVLLDKNKITDSHIQEPDVFDTWFSSGQWPFATLMSGKKDDFKNFYPTDVMETGWDILFFWVARMVMLGLYATDKVPFKTVYLHGLVRDKDRQKMSKSKGNVIDPLGVIDTYGADALRMALIVGNTPGNDPIIFEEKIKGYRNFATKIWNASRFVLMNTNDYKPSTKVVFSTKDKKIIKDFEKSKKEITKLMDELKFYHASEKIYHYFWHTFCDKIIESQKIRLGGEDKKEKQISQHLLLTILADLLKMLHPFMPFITEEIYQTLPIKKKVKLLMVEEWPN